MNEKERKIVEEFWSKHECSVEEKNFYTFPPIRAHSCQLIFGEYDIARRDWCEYWTVEKYLSICCGYGAVERILSKLNVAQTIIGTDIAPGAIQHAERKAREENLKNIEYRVADLNQEDLPENEFDIIWANGALHHIENLDIVISRLKRALKKGGFLVSNEYIGPKYQQIGRRQEEIINAARHLLPDELCDKNVVLGPYGNSIAAKGSRFLLRKLRRFFPANIYRKTWEKLPVGYFLKNDPSECVNSNNIIPILRKNFNEVDVRNFNGNILFYALDAKFYDNFDFQNSRHREMLDLLFRMEDTFIGTGEFSSDHAHIICRNI